MNAPQELRLSCLFAFACLAGQGIAAPGEDPSVMKSDDITAVSSKTFNGYTRSLRSDGTPEPETYGFAIGGQLSLTPGSEEKSAAIVTGDPSIDRTTFAEIAGVMQQALVPRRYVPTGEPAKAKLLITVFWGRTAGVDSFSGSDGSVKDGGIRDQINSRNARILGFDGEGHLFDMGFNDPSNMMANIRREVHADALSAVEEDRYLVILEAFDFQQVWKEKKAVRLWETRFSLSQRHHDFRSELPQMAHAAEHLFGEDSHGISYERVPMGQVEIGPLKNLGEAK